MPVGGSGMGCSSERDGPALIVQMRPIFDGAGVAAGLGDESVGECCRLAAGREVDGLHQASGFSRLNALVNPLTAPPIGATAPSSS